jgi:hypothetical protein
MSHWSFAAGWPTMLGAFALWAFSAWLCYYNWERSGRRAAIGRLEILRFILVTLLGFTLLRPEFVQVSKKSSQPEVAVLVDASRSMETRDIPGTNGPIRLDHQSNQIAILEAHRDFGKSHARSIFNAANESSYDHERRNRHQCRAGSASAKPGESQSGFVVKRRRLEPRQISG